MSGKPNEPFVGKVIGFPNVTVLLLLHNVKPFWYFGKIILNRCPIDAVLTNSACLVYVSCCVQARRCSSLVLSCICYWVYFYGNLHHISSFLSRLATISSRVGTDLSLCKMTFPHMNTHTKTKCHILRLH